MKAVAIIQARMGSTRLPGKVLCDIEGRTMLARVVSRAARAQSLDQVVVATTVEPKDQAVIEEVAKLDVPCHRGSVDDVLDRYYQVAQVYQPSIVVRITADCPLTDPAIIDRVVETLQECFDDVAYVSNTQPTRTFPRGLAVEAFRFDVLQKAWQDDKDPAWREHVTPYIYRHPEQFCVIGVAHDEDLSHLRWTVDTREDLAFIREVYASLERDDFAWTDVLALLERQPELQGINQHVRQKMVPP